MSLSPKNPALKHRHSKERKQVVSYLRGKKKKKNWESVGEEERVRESCLAEEFLELLGMRAHEGGKL